ncbi:ATP-binding protein [Roseimarinus sediminis]|uniref:ATP-binding protein n=1 Tax=Roseimarinus sediminis TaxID=1610899 RepID=UPI003D1D87F3
MIERTNYMHTITSYIDKPFVKVISGLRRSGKSMLLLLLSNELIRRGIQKTNIILINFESFEFSDIDNYKKLYQYVKTKINNNQKHYLLIDEIQEVEGWEKAVNALRVDFDADIYISGSNSHLLSSELATYLAGRYIEIPVFTLSFKEYLQFRKHYSGITQPNIINEFNLYLRKGGFPAIHTGNYSDDMIYKAVYDIYSSAILRDTIQRHNIRDVELLERVVKFIFDNVGNNFSAKTIADYFKSQQRRIDLNTVYNYLYALEAAFIIYRIPRYDLKGKEILKTNEKYFVGDQSLLYALMGHKDRIISGVLENVVMLELKRKGYKVFVGKLNTKEIDFVAVKQNEKIYIQVAWRLSDQSTIDREFLPLMAISDNHPKYVITSEENWHDNIEGIQHYHIAHFLNTIL